MKLSAVCLVATSLFVLVGFSDADRHYNRYCQGTPAQWDEPAEADFLSADDHFSFLNRRATWARSVEQGNRQSYLEWLLPRYSWQAVTFADRAYGCYSHQLDR